MVRSFDLLPLLGALVIFVLFSSTAAATASSPVEIKNEVTTVVPNIEEEAFAAEMSCACLVKTKCFNKEFGEYLISHTGETLEVNQYGHLEKVTTSQVPEIAFCCGLYKLQTCAKREVKANCNLRVEDSFIDETTLDLLKNFTGSNYDCDFSNWYYKEGSPICWTIEGQFFACLGFLLFVLLLCLGSCICSNQSARDYILNSDVVSISFRKFHRYRPFVDNTSQPEQA